MIDLKKLRWEVLESPNIVTLKKKDVLELLDLVDQTRALAMEEAVKAAQWLLALAETHRAPSLVAMEEVAKKIRALAPMPPGLVVVDAKVFQQVEFALKDGASALGNILPFKYADNAQRLAVRDSLKAALSALLPKEKQIDPFSMQGGVRMGTDGEWKIPPKEKP